MIAVQTIQTTWTKVSRGGRLAVLRNRIPKHAPLRISHDASPVAWHEIGYGETNEFDSPCYDNIISSTRVNRVVSDNIEVECEFDLAILKYHYQNGAPARQYFDKSGNRVGVAHFIEVRANQWASMECNRRLTCVDSGNWWYEHIVVNVAVGDSLDSNVFSTTKPVECYSQIAMLR